MMTITEALAEIKLLAAKIDKKREFVLQNLVRMKQVADPNIERGGSKAVLTSELHAIHDLENNLTRIRTSIMKANLENTITVENITKPIYEWLVWRKEIAQKRANFLAAIYSQSKSQLDRIATQPQLYKDSDKPMLVELETNTDYMEFSAKAALIEEILNKLDGILALKNATIAVET